MISQKPLILFASENECYTQNTSENPNNNLQMNVNFVMAMQCASTVAIV